MEKPNFFLAGGFMMDGKILFRSELGPREFFFLSPVALSDRCAGDAVDADGLWNRLIT